LRKEQLYSKDVALAFPNMKDIWAIQGLAKNTEATSLKQQKKILVQILVAAMLGFVASKTFSLHHAR